MADLFQPRELSTKSLMQKMEMINSMSDYNQNIIEKDKLEKFQELKMKNRLEDLRKQEGYKKISFLNS